MSIESLVIFVSFSKHSATGMAIGLHRFQLQTVNTGGNENVMERPLPTSGYYVKFVSGLFPEIICLSKISLKTASELISPENLFHIDV